MPVLIKADVQGRSDGIKESDVMLAKGAGAPILGFNVRASSRAGDFIQCFDLEEVKRSL